VRTFSTLLAATLLTLCVGLQALEATGRWDGTLQDAGDEAIIVAVVLCVGSALVAARVLRHQFSLTRLQSQAVPVLSARLPRLASASTFPALDTSPPLSLRI